MSKLFRKYFARKDPGGYWQFESPRDPAWYLAQLSKIRLCRTSRQPYIPFDLILSQIGTERELTPQFEPDIYSASFEDTVIEVGNMIITYHLDRKLTSIPNLYSAFKHLFPSRRKHRLVKQKLRKYYTYPSPIGFTATLEEYFAYLVDMYTGHVAESFVEKYCHLDFYLKRSFAPMTLYTYDNWVVDYVNQQDNVLTRSSAWKNFMRARTGQRPTFEIIDDLILWRMLLRNEDPIPVQSHESCGFMREYMGYYLLAMEQRKQIPLTQIVTHPDVIIAQVGEEEPQAQMGIPIDVNVHVPIFESFFKDKNVEDLFEQASLHPMFDGSFMETVKNRCIAISTTVYNLCRWSHGKLTTTDLVVNVSSALAIAMPLDFVRKALWKIFTIVAQDDAATIHVILKCICVAVFILVAKALPGKKTIDELINRVHTIPRAMSGLKSFWTSIDDTVQHVVTLVEQHLFGRDTTATQAVYIDTVQKWADEVAEYSDLYKRRLINRDEETMRGAARLHTVGVRLLAQCQKQGYDVKNAHLIRSLLATTYKISEAALKSGADKSRVRMEPVIVWMSGQSGVGKSTISYPFILDIMKQVGQDMEKWEQNIYARVPETEYWDGYVDQEYIIYDDGFQLKDTVAKPSPELFEIIRLGNLFPYQLHMASIEEKNNTFAQPKMIYISSNLEHIQAHSIHFPEAVERRIDFAFHVTLDESYCEFYESNGRTLYKLDKSKCQTSEDQPIDFNAFWFYPFDPHTQQTLGAPMRYHEIVELVGAKMKSRSNTFSTMSGFLHRYKNQPCAQAQVGGCSGDRWTCQCGECPSWRLHQEILRRAQEEGVYCDRFCDLPPSHRMQRGVLPPGYKVAETWYEKLGCAVRSGAETVGRFAALSTAHATCKALDWWSPDWHVGSFDLTKLYMAADNLRMHQDRWLSKLDDPLKQFNLQQTFQDKDWRFSRYVEEPELLAQCDVDDIRRRITLWRNWVQRIFKPMYYKLRFNLPGVCLKTLGLMCAFGVLYKLYATYAAPKVLSLKEKIAQIQSQIELAESCIKSGKCDACIVCQQVTEQDTRDMHYWGVTCKCYINVMRKNDSKTRRLFMKVINMNVNAQVSPNDTITQSRLLDFALTCDCDECPLCDEDAPCECRQIAIKRGVAIGEDDLLDRAGVYGRMQHELNIKGALRVTAQSPGQPRYNRQGRDQAYVQSPGQPRYNRQGRDQAYVQSPGTPRFNKQGRDQAYVQHQEEEEIDVQHAPCQKLIKKMEKVAREYPDDKNVASFVAKLRKLDPILDAVDRENQEKALQGQGGIVSQARSYETYDVNGEQIMENRLWPNLMRIYLVGEKDEQVVRHFGHILALRGSCFLMNWHFVLCLRDAKYANKRVVIRCLNNTVLYMDTVAAFLRNVTQIANKDACVVVLEKRTMQSFPNIVKHFQPKMTRYSRESQSITIVRYRIKDTDMMHSPIMVNDATLLYEPKTISLNSETKFINPTSWVYSAATRDGDCGAVLMLNNCHIPTKIVGIHNALSMGTATAYGVPLYQEEIEAALMQIPSMYQYGWRETMSVNPEEVVNFKDGDNFLVVGTLKTPIDANTNTCLQKSPIHGQLIEPQTMPGFLRKFTTEDGTTIDPVTLARKKWGYHQPEICKRTSERATDFITQLFNRKIKNDTIDYHYPMTTEEAIVGIDGVEHMNSINKVSSPGFPFVLDKLPGKGKTGYFGAEEFDLTLPGAKFVMERVKNMESMIIAGERPRVIWIDTMKDARIPIEKAMRGKTRVFSAGPMDYVILYRKYFLPYFGHLMTNRIHNFMAPGINAVSPEWHHLALKLKSKGEKCIAGDYSNYDGKACVDGYKALCVAACAWYIEHWEEVVQQGRHIIAGHECTQEEFSTFLHRVFFEVLNHIHACNYETPEGRKLLFYQVVNGMPSGNPGTAIANSCCGIWMFVYCWLKMTDTHELRHLNNLNSFNKFVYMCTYGDDVVANISDVVIEWFNQRTLTDAMKEHFDLEFTDEDKTGVVVDHRSLADIRFLKRAFVYNEYVALYISPLPEDVILDISNFVKKGGEKPFIVTLDNLKTIAAELALISSEVFHKWRPKIIKIGNKLAYKCQDANFVIETYHTYLDRYRCAELESNIGFSTW